MTVHRPVARTFWQKPAGWTKVSGRVSAGSAVIGSYTRGGAGEVAVGQPARPVADRSLGAQAVGARIGPDELAIGDPDLVFGPRAVDVMGRRDPRVARMTQQDVGHRDEVVA